MVLVRLQEARTVSEVSTPIVASRTSRYHRFIAS